MNNPGEALGTQNGMISSAVGAADASDGQSYDLQKFLCCHKDSEVQPSNER
jgi:hypothetical protein